MAISLNSFGHFWAKVFTVVKNDVTAVAKTETVVESITAQIPKYGPLAVGIEKLAYAGLGELAAVLNAGGDAAKAKLADAGLDVKVLESVQAAVTSVPTIAAVAKSL